MTRRKTLPLILFPTILGLLFTTVAQAGPVSQINPPPVGPPPEGETVEPAVVYPPDQAEGAAVESSGAGTGDQPISAPNTAMQIFQTIKNIVTLSRSSLVEAYEGVVEAAFTKKFSEIKGSYSDAIQNGIGMIDSYGQGGLSAMLASVGVSDEVEELWRVTMGVATVFFPLVLVANIASVYVSGVSAPLARAEMLQQGASALLRFVAAGASFWIVNQLIILGWATAEAIGTEAGGIAHAGAVELSALIIGLLFGTFSTGFSIVMFYISLFLLFFMLLMIGALILGHLAFMTLVVVWVVISPLSIVIGGLPYFGWVQGIWLRLGTGVMLLPIVNVILYRFALVMLPNFSSGGNLMQTVVAIGFLSLLTTVNFTIGKFVFGPVLEAIKKTNQSVRKLGSLAVSIAGFGIAAAGGGSALGGLMGASGAVAPGGGGAAALNAPMLLPGANGVSESGGRQGIYGESPAAQRLTERAQAGQIDNRQLHQAKANARLTGSIGRELARNDPMFSLATSVSTARTEHALASAEANMPDPNTAGAVLSRRSSPAPVLRDVPTRVFGADPKTIDSPKRNLVTSRAEMIGNTLHEAGHLEAVANAGVDPADYVAQMTAMSLADTARNDLNRAGGAIMTYENATARFDNMGASLFGRGAVSEVHERLRRGFESDVHEKKRSVTVEMIQNWLENRRIEQ